MIASLQRNNMALAPLHSYQGIDADYDQILTRTSSGLALNKPSEATPKFMLSEKLRNSLGGYAQASKNTDTAINYVQSMESGFDQINQELKVLKTVVLHAANDSSLDESSRAIDQEEINRSLAEIDRVVNSLSFAQKTIFKGNDQVFARVNNPQFTVIKIGEKAKESKMGHPIVMEQVPTKASVTTLEELTEQNFGEDPLVLDFFIGTRKETYSFSPKTDPTKVAEELNRFFKVQNLSLDASFNQGKLSIQHKNYGSLPVFQIRANQNDVFSANANEILTSKPGLDIQVEIGGEEILGKGEKIYGRKGGKTDGLEMVWNAEIAKKQAEMEANEDAKESPKPVLLEISNRPFSFHIGKDQGEVAQFFLPPIDTKHLGLNVKNESKLGNLNEISVKTFLHAQDSILLIDQAVNEITQERGKIGVFQKLLLEQNQKDLASKKDNTLSGESAIRDADMAKTVMEMTKKQLQSSTNAEILKNSNGQQKQYLRLFRA